MAAILWSDVTNHDADLVGVDADAQTDILGYVNASVKVALFGGEDAYRTKLVRIALASHLGALWMRANDADTEDGEVISETISATSVSVDYAKQSSGESLDETQHGRAYRSMIRRSAARVGFVP